MITRFLCATLFLVTISGCASVVVDPDAVELPDPVEDPFLKKWSFHLPSEGTPNDHGTIGPFCCTGVTAVVEAKDGYTVGYAYFKSWYGQAYNTGNTAIAPDVAILVAGLEDAYDANSKLIESEIDWGANEMAIGATRSAQAGDLTFTALIEDVDLTYGSSDEYSGAYYDMSTLAVRVDIAVADASP